METVTLEVQKREVLGSKVKTLRNEGLLPAVVYGGEAGNHSIALDARGFDKVYKTLGDSTLIDLKIGEEKPLKVLVHDVQREALYDRIIHVDFREVTKGQKIDLDVELVLVGEAPAVKTHGGIILKNMDTVAVSCLPSNLVSNIEVDLSGMENLGDVIRVKDLPALEGVEIKADADDAVVVVNAPVSEEEIAALDDEVTENVESVKVEGEEKKEGEGDAKAE